MGIVTDHAERADGAADLGEGSAFGGAVVEEEAVDLVPVDVPVGLGDLFGEAPRAVRGVEVAEDADTRVAQTAGRLQAARVGVRAGAVGDVEDDPVQGRARAGEAGPFVGGDEGVGQPGDTDAGACHGAGDTGPRAGQIRHAASIQMSARDSSRPIRGRQPSRSRAVRTSACCQLPQPSGYG